MINKVALSATVVLSAAALTACGGGNDFEGQWSGDITATEAGQPAGAATLHVDGGKCEWSMTEVDGQTNTARCEQDNEEFKLADPLTGRDLKYVGSLTGDALTLTPDNDRAEQIGVIVLQRN